MSNNTEKEAKVNLTEGAPHKIGWIILGIILGIISTPFFSPIIAHVYYPVDSDNPKIFKITPVDNSYLFETPLIASEVIDVGGSGLNIEKSYICLTSSTQSEITGNFSIEKNKLTFIPNVNLSPDIYTATFTVVDKANNIEEKSTRFVILEKPKFRFDLYEQPNAYFEGDEVHNLIWKERYIPYYFSIINEGSSLSLENIEISYNFPGVILGSYIMADIGCINCEINEGLSKPSIVYDGETKTKISTCQLFLEIDKLSPDGIYAGTLFIDPLYEPTNDEIITFCEWESNYIGSYIHSQFGKTYREQINGEIEVKPEVYFNKGINYRKNGLDEKFTPDLELSILCFDKAIKLGKNDSETWNEMGISFYYLGKLSEAIFCFNEALNLDSQFKTSHYNIGIIFMKLGNFEAATGYAKKALLIDENFEDAKSLIEICESINTAYLPEGFPRDSLANLNEEEGTLFFTMSHGNLQDYSLEEVIIFDFNKGGSRYILVRDADFNLVYSHSSIQTGFRVAKIYLKNVTLNPEEITISITWSEDEDNLYIFDVNSDLISERAMQLDDMILINALEQQPFFEFDRISYFQPRNNFTFNIISVSR